MAEQVENAKTYGYDTDALKNIFSEVDRIEEELLSERGTYMAKCAKLREEKKDIISVAKDKYGVPTKVTKSVLKAREFEKKAAAARDDLEGDDQDSHDNVRLALGDLADLPLGQPALQQAAE